VASASTFNIDHGLSLANFSFRNAQFFREIRPVIATQASL
jgi:hypothetical protein